jgi:hypothetical protein
MTRGRGNTRIFSQMGHFSKILIVWGAGVGVLAVCGAKRITSGNLRG